MNIRDITFSRLKLKQSFLIGLLVFRFVYNFLGITQRFPTGFNDYVITVLLHALTFYWFRTGIASSILISLFTGLFFPLMESKSDLECLEHPVAHPIFTAIYVWIVCKSFNRGSDTYIVPEKSYKIGMLTVLLVYFLILWITNFHFYWESENYIIRKAIVDLMLQLWIFMPVILIIVAAHEKKNPDQVQITV